MKIRIILPPWTKGGLRTIASRIIKGLAGEGYSTEIINLKDRGLVKVFLNDVKCAYKSYCNDDTPDAVLYIGSIPLPGHLIYRYSSVPSLLFIHGYTKHQLITILKSSRSWRVRLGAIALLLGFDLSRIFRTIDFYIAHSETVHEMCQVPPAHRIILPQFMFKDEIKELHKLGNKIRSENIDLNENVKILAYTSHALSPRLLSIYDLIALGKSCSRRISRRIKLVIIDPHSTPLEKGFIKIMNFLPRDEFLKELATSALYIEGCIDDEIRYGALEALALGTPVAKIVHPKYLNRCDYSGNELLVATSFKAFLEKLIHYIGHLDHLYPAYSQAGFNFVKAKRVWDVVKTGLIKCLVKI